MAIKAQPMPGKYNRYQIINTETGEILDDAQGYGYRSAQKAYAAYNYKHRSPKQKHNAKKNAKLNQEFLKQHKSFVKNLDEISFEIAKGSWGTDDKFDYQLFKQIFNESGLEFTGNLYSLYNYYLKH